MLLLICSIAKNKRRLFIIFGHKKLNPAYAQYLRMTTDRTAHASANSLSGVDAEKYVTECVDRGIGESATTFDVEQAVAHFIEMITRAATHGDLIAAYYPFKKYAKLYCHNDFLLGLITLNAKVDTSFIDMYVNNLPADSSFMQLCQNLIILINRSELIRCPEKQCFAHALMQYITVHRKRESYYFSAIISMIANAQCHSKFRGYLIEGLLIQYEKNEVMNTARKIMQSLDGLFDNTYNFLLEQYARVTLKVDTMDGIYDVIPTGKQIVLLTELMRNAGEPYAADAIRKHAASQLFTGPQTHINKMHLAMRPALHLDIGKICECMVYKLHEAILKYDHDHVSDAEFIRLYDKYRMDIFKETLNDMQSVEDAKIIITLFDSKK